MRLESQRLEKQINSLESQLKSFPEGKLICSQNGNRYKWFCSDGHNSVYIPKSERKLAEQLAVKKYLLQVKDDLIHEKRAIDFYLRHHVPAKAEEMLTNMPAYQELLSPYFKSKSQRIEDWKNSPYEQNPFYPEKKIHKTPSGNLVRSKSEALIDMILYTNGIPFRYDCALQLDDYTLYPDFTILNPKTEEIIYWEHFGMMDDPKYSNGKGNRLQRYFDNGIIPFVNMITTYETAERPLTADLVEKIVKEEFL